jgi:hypothetical protein
MANNYRFKKSNIDIYLKLLIKTSINVRKRKICSLYIEVESAGLLQGWPGAPSQTMPRSA